MARRTTRRQFHQTVAALALPASVAEAAQAEKPRNAVEALVELIRARHGKQLDDEQLKAVRRSVERTTLLAEQLKKFPLKNGDEPDVTFSADLS